MGRAIGELLPSAVGVAISPLPIVAMVLMLVSAHGRANGPAFLLGWVAGYWEPARSCSSSPGAPTRTRTGLPPTGSAG